MISRQVTESWIDRMAPRPNLLWRGEWRGGHIEPQRFLFDHELVFVTKGSCEIQIEEERFDAGAGEFFIVPPGKCHVSAAGPTGVFRLCVHFDWDGPDRPPHRAAWSYFPARPKASELVLAPAGIPRTILRGNFPLSGSIVALLETLFIRWSLPEPLERSLCRPVLHEILIRLFANEVRPRNPAGADWMAYTVKDLLDRSEDASVGVQDLLRSLGFSYEHLCRSFRRTFGLTPTGYRNARRLEKAKTLLGDPRMTIAEVACQSGFTEPCYFSRQFRRRNGMSPQEWRRVLLGHREGLTPPS